MQKKLASKVVIEAEKKRNAIPGKTRGNTKEKQFSMC
jgi:hypothetical protein